MKNALTESANEAKIINLENLPKNKVTKIIELMENNWSSVEKLSKLSELVPKITSLQKDSLDSIKPIADGIKTTQVKSIESTDKTFESSMQIISKLADKATTDESIIALAEITKNIANTHATQTKETNKDNNEAWQNITKYTIAAAIGVIGLTFKILNKK